MTTLIEIQAAIIGRAEALFDLLLAAARSSPWITGGLIYVALLVLIWAFFRGADSDEHEGEPTPQELADNAEWTPRRERA